MASPLTEKTDLSDPGASAECPWDQRPMCYEDWQGATAAGWICFVLRALFMIASLLFCLPFYCIWRLLRLSNPWPKLFLRSCAFACGARVKTIGTPLKRDVFFTSNHLSWIDIPILGGYNGSAFVAQDGIASWPFIGWLCTLNNTVFVSRADRMGVAKQINQIRDALEDSWALTIFPEGTTTDGSTLLPFKAALMAVLDPPPPGIMVQPVFLDFGEYGREIAWVGDEGAPQNAWRILTRPGNFRVSIHFLEPFDPDAYNGRKAIATEAQKRIDKELSASRNAAANV